MDDLRAVLELTVSLNGAATAVVVVVVVVYNTKKTNDRDTIAEREEGGAGECSCAASQTIAVKLLAIAPPPIG